MKAKNKAGIVWDLHPDEIAYRIKNDGWTLVEQEKPQQAIQEPQETIKDLWDRYEAKHGKPVPNNKKNDAEWISSKL